MTSQPHTDAKLTEAQRGTIAIESRIVALTAAVYFLIGAAMIFGGTFAGLAFPNEIRAEVQMLEPATRDFIRWLVYLPALAFGIGGYYLYVAHRLRGELFQ